MRAWVELIHYLDAAGWPARNATGEVPNATPFGIDQLSGHGVDVAFREVLTGRVPNAIARRVRDRAGGLEWFEAVASHYNPLRRSADVVLCWDEFTGIPAASLPGGPPVVSGVQLLTDPQNRSKRFLRTARRALENMEAVFVQAHGMIPVLRDEWNVPVHKLKFVPFGVDSDWFRPIEGDVDRDLVASVGDDGHRDHDTLIKAVADVRRHRPGTRLELATQLDVELPSDLGVLHRGHLGRRRRQFYGSANVVAVATKPNIHGSGMSVILEAMACGRPYVVTASEGLEGYLNHGHDGLVVPPGDVEVFASAVGALMADPERADAMGQAGRARLERELTTDVQAQHLAEVLKEVARTR
ncbi:glycosyltransferase family 4 protein [Kibdelosporangium persicum]|uniref:glycosyltransferase family 4 protein n=1 Tax=Kibdelosporangium persicum TaxID=2698649 RepID=UPI001566E27F|nr:glycosyltransferase family 4 protein [Kibdelosporangium persicum]